MRYIATDCFSDGVFLPETEAEVAEANRLNARQPGEPVDPAPSRRVIIFWAAVVTAFVIGAAFR